MYSWKQLLVAVTVHGVRLKCMDAPYLTAALLGGQMVILFSAETNTVMDILVAQIFGSLSCTWIEGYEGFQDPHKAKWLSPRIDHPQMVSFKGIFSMPMHCVICSFHE